MSSTKTLEDLLGGGKLDQMLWLAARIGQSSGMIDPMADLDRKELREWRDAVVAALGRAEQPMNPKGTDEK